ncbi:MAG TPA: dihydrodipicolinate synthase family protein, partial [Pilimelia sp.]|nr:dihydrodipicolinate synthase family protein [Pilimelia sp.]
TGVVALGTTAAPAARSAPERRAGLDVLAGVCRGRAAPLLVGANTVDAVATLRGRPEVRAALSVVPAFSCPGEAGVLAHFRRLAAASPVPIVVYHVPHRTGQSLSAGALRQLAALPGVAGVKHAVGGIDDDTVALMADVPAGFAVLAGDDVFLSPLLALGAHGAITASAHVATARFAELVEAWRTGDAARARVLGHRLAGLARALFAEPNPAVVKAVLHARGEIPTAAVRLPLLPAGADTTRTALQHAETLQPAVSTQPAAAART